MTSDEKMVALDKVFLTYEQANEVFHGTIDGNDDNPFQRYFYFRHHLNTHHPLTHEEAMSVVNEPLTPADASRLKEASISISDYTAAAGVFYELPTKKAYVEALEYYVDARCKYRVDHEQALRRIRALIPELSFST